MNMLKNFKINEKGNCANCESKLTLQMFSNRRMFCTAFLTYVMKNKQCEQCKTWLKENKQCGLCKHFEYSANLGRKCLKGNNIIENKDNYPIPENEECFEEKRVQK